MSMGIDVSNNVGIARNNDVASICQPLYRILGLTYFNYVKLFADGSRAVLTDRPDFIIEYYKRKELFETQAIAHMESSKNFSWHLSCEFKDQMSYRVASRDFNIDNGITIIQPHGNETELYYFGTTRDNCSRTSFYVTNIDILQRFIAYFKDRAHYLLSLAEKDRFFMPNHKIIHPLPVEEHTRFLELRSKFIQATPLEKYVFNQRGITLPKREAECLYHLSYVKSAKEIARLMGISSRTVEHYINQLRERFDCPNKNALKTLLEATDFQEMLNCFAMNQ